MSIEQADAHQRKHGFKPVLAQLQAAVDEASAKIKGKLRNVRAREMNKTEREFSLLLEARKTQGELIEWRFHALRLQWGGGMHYTADFAARRADGNIEIHEVKGAHIFSRDTVRFKGCRAEWQQWGFIFHFHQRTKDGQWHQLL